MLTDEQLQQVQADAGNLATLLLTMRNLCGREPDERALIVETLAQKAGWLADRILGELGAPPVCGGWADWTEPSGD